MVPEKIVLKLYEQLPQLIINTKFILDNSSISFEFGKSKNKKFFTGSEKEDTSYLLQLCNENLHYRYPHADQTVVGRYEKEIKAKSM